MSSSLGFRRACEYNAGRPPPITPVETAEPPAPVRWCTCGVFKGFLPLLLFSCMAAAVPATALYINLDFSDALTCGLIAGASGVLATGVVLANHCATWYNMVLFFHTAVEVRVLDVVITYALAEDTGMTAVALAWTGASIVIVHLLPFFVLDMPRLLILLAWAGVIVNTSLVVYIDATLLVLTLSSALAFLLVTLFTFGSECAQPSLASQLRDAINGGKLISCETFVV